MPPSAPEEPAVWARELPGVPQALAPAGLLEQRAAVAVAPSVAERQSVAAVPPDAPEAGLVAQGALESLVPRRRAPSLQEA